LFIFLAEPANETVILVLNKKEIDGAHKNKPNIFSENFRVSYIKSSFGGFIFHGFNFSNQFSRLRQFFKEYRTEEIALIEITIQMELTIMLIQGLILLTITIVTNNQ
jgi:hypothetical protein